MAKAILRKPYYKNALCYLNLPPAYQWDADLNDFNQVSGVLKLAFCLK